MAIFLWDLKHKGLSIYMYTYVLKHTYLYDPVTVFFIIFTVIVFFFAVYFHDNLLPHKIQHSGKKYCNSKVCICHSFYQSTEIKSCHMVHKKLEFKTWKCKNFRIHDDIRRVQQKFVPTKKFNYSSIHVYW